MTLIQTHRLASYNKDARRPTSAAGAAIADPAFTLEFSLPHEHWGDEVVVALRIREADQEVAK